MKKSIICFAVFSLVVFSGNIVFAQTSSATATSSISSAAVFEMVGKLFEYAFVNIALPVGKIIVSGMIKLSAMAFDWFTKKTFSENSFLLNR